MILRITKKARNKIKLHDSELIETTNSYYFLQEWYVNIFTLNRKKYFIFTEAKSLYSLVYDSKGINSKKPFIEIAKNLVKTSIEENFSNIKIDKVLNQEIEFAKTENKGVLGSQVDLIYMATARYEIPEYTNFRFINETPMSFLKFHTPEEEFKIQFSKLEKLSENSV